jgi:oxygen-independent coproporphyrinogen-3 oxidase
VTVLTPIEAFYNDLCDVVRLFYGDALRDDGDGRSIVHTARGWSDRFALCEQGVEIAAYEHAEPEATGDALEVTRMRKRACKNTLYALLKRHTGKTLPWGALTGIRPTRLYAEAYARLGDEEAATRALRETFDVTREKAVLLRNIARSQARAPLADENGVDVYAGIPFCPTRCSYCSFAAEAIGTSGHLLEPYLDALEAEIRAGAVDLAAMGRRARAVYLGGGTPTVLSALQLDRLLGLLRTRFPGAVEWTVEAGRPDTIDEERLRAIAGQGVKRISINPQTMNDDTLRAIGRDHTARDIERAMELAARFSFDVVNMDLIAGLPGEGVGDVSDTLRRVIGMGARNITVHTLAIKRTSRLRMSGEAELPRENVAEAMVDAAADALREAGYEPYYLYRQKYMAGNLENVGYALPGWECLYNIDNMEETLPILAFGAGAITKWLFPAQRRIERAANVRNIEQYIARVQEMAGRKRKVYGTCGDGGGEK